MVKVGEHLDIVHHTFGKPHISVSAIASCLHCQLTPTSVSETQQNLFQNDQAKFESNQKANSFFGSVTVIVSLPPPSLTPPQKKNVLTGFEHIWPISFVRVFVRFLCPIFWPIYLSDFFADFFCPDAKAPENAAFFNSENKLLYQNKISLSKWTLNLGAFRGINVKIPKTEL